MKSAIINGKEYKFMFNANTLELYFQVFKEDLATLMLFEFKNDNQLIMKNQRCPRLAYIANMQASHSFRELSNRLSMENYMEWLEQFPAGTFFYNVDALKAVVGGFNENIAASVEIKNPESQQ